MLCDRNLIKEINTWTILKMNKGRTQANGPKDKETDDYAKGLTSKR